MKYIIQIFRTTALDANGVGFWSNTAWGNDDLEKALETATRIAKGNKMGIIKVRVAEVISELDCDAVEWPIK